VYDQLFAAWRREIEEASLGGLPPDFYGKIAEYMRRIKEDNELDQKTIKINLLEHEAQNAELMLTEILELRYKKIIKIITKNQKIPLELLTVEEGKMAGKFATFSAEYQKFKEDLKQGQLATPSPIKVTIETDNKLTATQTAPTQKRLTIRFTKNIPAIMGADMKSYGPFNAEDVASLPTLNAQILVKQGLAVLVEVS
jgi:DNA replication factor GINS